MQTAWPPKRPIAPAFRPPRTRRQESASPARILCIRALVTLAFLGLAARLWYLQIYRGNHLFHLSEENRTRVIRSPAPRGTILDRRGQVLADNRRSLALTVLPDFKKDNPHLLDNLAPILHTSAADLAALVAKAQENQYNPIAVAEDVDVNILAQVEEHRDELAGVVIQPHHVRHYPNGRLATHLLGYLGDVTPQDLKRLAPIYRPGDLEGMSGVEREYNTILHGTDGLQSVEVDASGRYRGSLNTVTPHEGDRLTLAIDARVQQAAVEGLDKVGKPGAVVAIDPRNGDVLALASSPTFDLNALTGRQRKKTWQAIVSNHDNPIQDRAISNFYPPGSTFKMITGTAGWMAGAITPFTRVNCPGGMEVGGRFKRCWKVHGPDVNFNRAIAESCDVFFYTVGRTMGPRPILKFAREYGLGRKTGIDLPFERRGTLPHLGDGRNWYFGDTANISIGQGAVQATALQMALATAAMANGGTVYRPRVLLEADGPQGRIIHPPQVVRHLTASAKVLERVKEAMRQTVTAGTGRAAALPGIEVGAKTGTAENPHGPGHGWFTCFAPVQHPTIAIAAIIEGGEHGFLVAPIARAMMQSWFGLKRPDAVASRAK